MQYVIHVLSGNDRSEDLEPIAIYGPFPTQEDASQYLYKTLLPRAKLDKEWTDVWQSATCVELKKICPDMFMQFNIYPLTKI